MKLRIFVDYLFLSNFFQKIFDADVNDEIIPEASIVVRTILFEYTEKIVRITNISNDEYEILKQNPLYEQCLDSGEFNVLDDIEDYIRENDCYYSLFFMYDNKNWFEQVISKGAICFSLDNYQKKIKEIIDKTHIRIDLSEKFIGWGKLLKEVMVIPTKKIIITDNYILKDDIKIENNLAVILKELIHLNETTVIIYTDLHKDNLSDKIGKRYKKIKALVNGSYNLALISSEKDIRDDKCFNLHDRLVYCDYLLIESTQGFNISHKVSNSQIIIETIFNKYTYKRRNSHLKYLNNFFKSLQENNLYKSRFVIYPSNALLT